MYIRIMETGRALPKCVDVHWGKEGSLKDRQLTAAELRLILEVTYPDLRVSDLRDGEGKPPRLRSNGDYWTHKDFPEQVILSIS